MCGEGMCEDGEMGFGIIEMVGIIWLSGPICALGTGFSLPNSLQCPWQRANTTM